MTNQPLEPVNVSLPKHRQKFWPFLVKELNEEEAIIMEDLNKYLFKSNINYKFKQKIINISFSVFMLELKSLSSHICEWREEQLNLISKQIQQNFRSIQSPLKEKCEKIKKIYCNLLPYGSGHKFKVL
jgi:hypothetical protein